MNKLTILFVVMLLVNILTTTILGLVGVNFSEYVYYLFWFNLLCIFLYNFTESRWHNL